MIISMKKRRKIGFSHISLTGSLVSIKNNETIDFESSLERDYIYLLEYDNNVKYYWEQPFTLEYYEDDSKKVYTPDFLVEYYSGNKILVEIKYEADLMENKIKYKNKFSKTSAFCKTNNMQFKVISEKHIRTEILFNAKFLCYYKNPKNEMNYGDVNLLWETLKRFHKMTVTQLLEECSRDDFRRAELLYCLWFCISNDFFDYEKSSKLTMNSIVSIKS